MQQPILGVNKLPNGTFLKGAEEVIHIWKRHELGEPVIEVLLKGSATPVLWTDILRFRGR
ncbi:MAG TPA: hypothetical protein VG934_01305 [Candidatus Paceibacterota bacterium]|nr:hypothetical protein [Candidatus Paceibacterota bacterium]